MACLKACWQYDEGKTEREKKEEQNRETLSSFVGILFNFIRLGEVAGPIVTAA